MAIETEQISSNHLWPGWCCAILCLKPWACVTLLDHLFNVFGVPWPEDGILGKQYCFCDAFGVTIEGFSAVNFSVELGGCDL